MENTILPGKDSKSQYRLEGLIGSGTFGKVYGAKDVIVKRNVAVKIFIVPSGMSEEEARLDWEREAKQSLGLNGPNVIKSYDFQRAKLKDEEIVYLVMELADRGNLQKIIDSQVTKGEFLSNETLKEFFLQILSGVETIHAQSLHRDLKPQNILNSGGKLKITDFGLSKYVDEATRTKTYKGWGTYYFMAPESWDLGRTTAATDIYSLGIIFFQLSTLRLPYSSENVTTLEQMHKYDPIPRASGVNSNLSPKFDGIIRKMMEKGQNSRYQTVQEIVAELSDNGSSDLSTPTISVEAIALAKQKFDQEQQEVAARKRVADEQAEQLKKNRYKISELMEKVYSWVEQFNKSVPEEKMLISMGDSDTFTLIWKGRDLIRIEFSPTIFDQDLSLNGQQVLAHAFFELKVGKKDEGINFELVKAGESEQYGKWRVLKAEHSPLVARTTIYPLALAEHGLAKLAAQGGAMGVLQHSWSDDIDQTINDIIQKSFVYLNQPPSNEPRGDIGNFEPFIEID